MKYIVDGKTMKKLDDYTIEEVGIPSMVLMERAALAITNVLLGKISEEDSIIVMSGPGNNGADGIALARILTLKGYKVDVYIMGEKSRFSKQLREQNGIGLNLGINFINNAKMSEYNVVIDAIFGIGLSKEITGEFYQVIKEINENNNYVVSVDIPSGIHSGLGKVMGIAVKADETVTFGYQKLGMVLYPGADYAGRVTVADIGFPTLDFAKINPSAVIYEPSDVEKLPVRSKDSNKGTFGKVLVIAGSNNMSGACYMSGKAAYRMGAGLVKLLTVKENRVILQGQLPEAVLSTYDASDLANEKERIANEICQASVVVFGPGIGVSDISRELLQLVLKYSEVPTVIDADGLNVLSELGPLQELKLKRNLILTPHIKEMSRLMHGDIGEIKNNIVDTAKNITNGKEYILVLKDARTVVAGKGEIYINCSGNNGMATGGSGDVLSGIIAGMLAQGMDTMEAARLGVYVHGLAGDYAREKFGEHGMMATDIIDEIPTTMLMYNKM